MPAFLYVHAGTKMQFSVHFLPLMQLLFSTATVTAVSSSIESSGQGSTESVLYPYTTDGVEIQTDDPMTPTDEPESPPPNDSTTRDDVQLQTTTEQHAATTDVSSVTEAVPSESTDAELSSTFSEETSSLPLNIEYYGTTTQPEATVVSNTITEGSPTPDEYQTAAPGTTLSTITEQEHTSSADSPATLIFQSTAELTLMSPTTAESTKESPAMDQTSVEDSTVTVSPAGNKYRDATTESSNIIISPATEPPIFPTTADSTTGYDATIQLPTEITELKSSTSVTPTLEKLQFGNTMAILSTPSQSTEGSPTADVFGKGSIATDFSAFTQPLSALFTENPSTANKYLMTAEHATIMDRSTTTMASNNDQSKSPITNAVYSISNTATRASLSSAIDVYSTATLQSSKESVTLAISSQSASTIKSPSVMDHQTIAMDLKFSTASYSHNNIIIMSPTTGKYMHTSTSASLVSLSAIDSKSTPVLKPHSVTQLGLMTTTEFPSFIDFPTTSPHKSSLSNADFMSRTVATYFPSSLMIQPTSVAFAKSITSSTTLSTTNSARVMSSVNFESNLSMSMSLHAHYMESSSVTPVQSPTIHNLSTASQPLPLMLTSEVLTSPVPQATGDLSLATITLESTISDSMPFSTMKTSNLTSPVSRTTTIPESPIPTVSMPLSTMLVSNILMSPEPQATVDLSLATTNLESTVPTISDSMPLLTTLASNSLTSPLPQATTTPESQFSTTAQSLSLSTVLASRVLTSPVPQATANSSLVVTTTPKSQIPTTLTLYSLTPPEPQTTATPSLATTTLEPPTSRLATKFVETSGYETITKSASTMESIVPVESTTIPRTSFESIQHHSITESPIATPRISNTEFLVVAKSSMLTNYHSATTNYYSILDGFSTITESRITREFLYKTQQVSSTAIKFHSLDLQHSTTVDHLRVSLLSTVTTKYLTTSPPYSSPSPLPRRQVSTEISSQFPSTSTDPPSQYTQSPVLTVSSSPTVTESESGIIHLASSENPTKSIIKSALFTSSHATVLPASTETEPRSQSEPPKITVNLSQSHSQTSVQFLTPIISPFPASMMFSDAITQSNVKPTLTSGSSVNVNISAINSRELSNTSTMIVGSIFTNESSRPTPVIESSNTVFPTTSDQIPVTTPSTDVFLATEITATDSPTTNSFLFNLASTPEAGSISPSESPPSPSMESLVITESHPIPSQTIKTSSTTDSMIDAINSTMTDISSMRSESESIIFTQPMLSINDPLRTLATSQLLETTAVTESQFMKSSIELKVLTITDAPSTVATTNGSTFTMTVESPFVTPSQTGTAKSATSIDLVMNDVPQPTQGHLISIEPTTTNYSPSRESSSVTDTHTTTTPAIKVSSIIRSNQLQSSDQDTVTISVPIMSSMTTKSKTHTQSMLSITPTEMLTIISSEFATDSNFIGTQIIQSSGLEATIGVVTPSVTMDVPEPTAMAPSDSITESSTIPTPLKSMTVPEFETTINPLAITGSSKVRATESHPAQPQMTMVSTSSEGYQSSTSTFTVSPPPALAVAISPTPSKIATNPSANVSLSENLAATTKSLNSMEILAANSEYSSSFPSTLITTAATISLSPSTIEQFISVTSSVSAPVIVPSATITETLSGTGLLIGTSPVIMRPPAIRSTTVDLSIESLTMKQSTTESVLIMSKSLDITMLPIPTETLLPISTEQLTPVMSMTMTRLEGESLTNSGILVASPTVVFSLLPSLLVTELEYSSTFPITISSAAAISSSPIKTDYSMTASATFSSDIVPAVTVSESLSEIGVTTNPSSHISASPTIATMTVHVSAKSAAKQTTIELSNTIESILMLPESTETLLPTTSEQLMSLIIVTTTDSIRFEVESSTIPGLLVTYTASLNDTATTTVGPNVRLIESSSLLSSRYPESHDVTSPLTESQTATFTLPTVHPSMAVLSQSRESVLITQSAIQILSPSVTLKSLIDSSVSSTFLEGTGYPISLTTTFPTKAMKFSTMSESAVSESSAAALRSIINSESTAILTQTVATASHPSRFITVGSASILKPLPTMTKSVSNSPQHSTAATLVTIAESLRTASSTAPFPATLVLNLTATKSVMQISALFSSPHATVFPASTETEPRSQSEPHKMTVNLSQSHSQTNVQFLTRDLGSMVHEI